MTRHRKKNTHRRDVCVCFSASSSSSSSSKLLRVRLFCILFGLDSPHFLFLTLTAVSVSAVRTWVRLLHLFCVLHGSQLWSGSGSAPRLPDYSVTSSFCSVWSCFLLWKPVIWSNFITKYRIYIYISLKSWLLKSLVRRTHIKMFQKHHCVHVEMFGKQIFCIKNPQKLDIWLLR